MTDKVQLPRHKAIVDFLTSKAPKRFTTQSIAKETKLSPRTVANEMLVILQLYPAVQRSVRGRVFTYYVGQPERDIPKALEDYGKPTSLSGIGEVWQAATDSSYVPAVAKSAWKLTQVMALVTKAALSGSASTLATARETLEELSDVATAYAVTLSRVLATDELWSDPQWLTQGMPEENLEILAETTRQTLERLAKLDASKTEQEETKEKD